MVKKFQPCYNTHQVDEHKRGKRQGVTGGVGIIRLLTYYLREIIMTKKIMILMLLSLFLATNAIASLTYVAGTSEGVIYDDLNDTYWFSDLSVFTLWNFDQQITVIDTLPQTFTYPFIWHMATEQDILGLTQSYSPEIITSA